jgi:lipopolysaccharide export system permease protein
VVGNGAGKREASQGEARRVFNPRFLLRQSAKVPFAYRHRVNTFDRHLLRQWLQILGLVLAATCGLLVVQVLYEDFRELRELGARGAILWQYLGVRIPGFFAMVLPLALLVSLLYALGKLHRANEFTAMRAAGASYLRLTAPIWAVGVLCCGLSWWLNSSLVPWSVEYSRSIKESLQFHRDTTRALSADRIGARESVAFDNRVARRMWFFNRYSQFTQRGYGVSVSELDAQRRETTRIVAAEAWRDEVGRGWVFRHGRELTFNPETREITGSKPFTEKLAPNYRDEDPDLMLLIDRRAGDLLLGELRELIAYLRVEHSPKVVAYEVRYYGLIADTLAPLIVIAIAIPFAVTGIRVNPAVGVSRSIGLFVLYTLLNEAAKALATKGLLEPQTAAWLPYLAMAALAAWLFARLR